MKRILLIAFSIAIVCKVSAQSYKITWGDETKIKKGTTDIDIIAADNTGLYFTESNLRVADNPGATNHKLYKFDQNFNPVYDKDYKKELKGYAFHSFQLLEKDLYMFATDYDKKEKQFTVFAARIDKTSGDFMGDFVEIGTYQLESKKDDYDLKVTSVQNGQAFLAVTNISGKDNVSLGITILDHSLKKKENAVINIAIEPARFALQDVQLTKHNKIVVLGKEFEEVPVKKKKTTMVFKQFNMAIYNSKGKKENDIDLSSSDKFIIEGKLIESPNGELLLGGFYSNVSKKNDLNGFFLNKIDPDKGVLKLSAYKEISAGMLGKSYEDPNDQDDEAKNNKKQDSKPKDDEDKEDLPNNFTIKSVDITANNSIIITSEISQYSNYTYTSSDYDSRNKTWNYTTNYVHKFTNNDILIIDADQEGNIKWINDLAKSQVEEIRTHSTSNSFIGYSPGYDKGKYFATGGGMPYYSSYASMLTNNSLILIMNDHSSNNVAASYGDKVKTIYNFKKNSNVYGVTIDLATGKMIKKFIAENNNEAILTPRNALVIGNDIYMPTWRTHAMAKTELKFVRISVKP